MLHRAIILTATLLVVSSCGFRPLYAPPSEDVEQRGVYAFGEFRRVIIENIPDREGQYLRNELVRLLQPAGRSGEANYVLRVRLTEVTQNLAVQKSAVATRANLRVTGDFTLAQINEEAEPFSDSASSSSGYNIFQSEFQTLMAEKGARERALDDLAQQIRIRLAGYLTSPKRKSSSP